MYNEKVVELVLEHALQNAKNILHIMSKKIFYMSWQGGYEV
jgi:hypothetical protein